MEHNYPRMYLVNEAVRNRVIETICPLPINESDPLGDISKQATWQGDKYDIYGWKNLIVSGHTIATKQPYKLVTGIEGELVNVRERTAKMGIKRMASLIEYTTAWGVENGIKFNDKWEF